MTAVAEPRMSRKERRAHRAQVTEAIEQGRPLALIASAAAVRTTDTFSNQRWGSADWQLEGWLHYDTCPEFRSGVELVASAVSRARLIGVDIDPVTGEPATQPTDNADVQQIMAGLFGGPSGQSQALAALTRHAKVAGDMYVLATDRPDADDSVWEVLGTGDVTRSASGTVSVTQMNGMPRDLDENSELIFRIWSSHPARRWEANSMTRALLPVLREIAALTAMVSATVKSRLASAGILWLPEELSLPPGVTGPVTENSQQRTGLTDADMWLDLITEAMTAPIQDPDSASAVVPLVSMVKGDLIEKISHMEFGHDLDGALDQLRQSSVQRLAVGMELPAEYLNGQGDANHWTGWLIAEDFNRFYVAPPLEMFCDAITRFYLRPALRGRGINADAYAVYFDITKLVPQQVSIENATTAWNAGLLSDEAFMEALGFSTAQMALPAERGRRLLISLLQTQPDALAMIVPVLAQMFPGSPNVAVPELPAAPVRETISAPASAPVAVAPTAAGGPPNAGVAPAPPVGGP